MTTAPTRGILRAGLAVLAAAQAVAGGWALLAPLAFFHGFPADGHAWVALLPPYNEHLVRDVGALGLALTVLLTAAAVHLDVRLVRVALVAFLVYPVPHTVFHGAHLDGFGTADAVAQMTGFALQLAVALGLLALTATRAARDEREPGRQPGPAEVAEP